MRLWRNSSLPSPPPSVPLPLPPRDSSLDSIPPPSSHPAAGQAGPAAPPPAVFVPRPPSPLPSLPADASSSASTLLSDAEWLATLPPARDPLYELHHRSSRLDANAFERHLCALPHFELSPYTSIPDAIRSGFHLRIAEPVIAPYFPKNAELAPDEVAAVDKAMLEDIQKRRLAGPYEALELMRSTGVTFRSSPISVATKETPPGKPQKYRLVENLSSPYAPTPEGVRSVNSALNPLDYPCRWTRLVTFLDFLRRLPPETDVMVADLESAFRQLDIEPSQRPHHGVVWRGKLFFRKTPSFGGASTPGTFGRVVDATLDIIENELPNVLTSSILDDLLFARTSREVLAEHILGRLEELGWIISKEKLQLWRRVFKFSGLIFDLEAGTVTLPPEKAWKFARRLELFLEGGPASKRSLKETLKVVGTLMYLTTVFAKFRPCVSALLAFRRTFPHDCSPFLEHGIGRACHKELSQWRSILSGAACGTPLSASFRLPSEFCASTIFTDASPAGLGVVIDDKYVLRAELVGKWREYASQPGGIVAPEGWAVEWAVEAATASGVRDCGLAVRCDNMGVVLGWQKGRSSNRLLNRTFARLLRKCEEFFLFLELSYVPTKENPADGPSRGAVDPRHAPFPLSLTAPPGTAGAPDP